MAIQDYHYLLILIVIIGSVTNSIADEQCREKAASLSRSSFPNDFIFGTASAAYQYEGAANEDGRGPSIWDHCTYKYPEKITDHSTGDVAVDEYHRYKEDIKIMKETGLDAYRFSISWSRILPNGKLSGGVNNEGIKYYNDLINELLANDIQPYVTLFHWDLPQSLEDEYGGFLSDHIVNDFLDFANVCFKEFGDRVKHWITLNEPWSYINGGYVDASLAPYRCSSWQNLNCTGGDSSVEPYLAAHNFLLSHAAAVDLYRQKYQETQKGIIGITLLVHWMIPLSDAKRDKKAAERAIDFMFGLFMDPLTKGEYPHSVRKLARKRLPKFSKEQSKMLKGSFDFLGLNYYTTKYAADTPQVDTEKLSYLTDALAKLSAERNGIPIGPQSAAKWLYVYPRGMQDLLLYTKKKYNNPIIYITENGYGDSSNSIEEGLADHERVDYYKSHLFFLQSAIEDGVNVKGYFAWSLLDNFEWSSGYSVRFGINYVDYKSGLKRYPKLSAGWFKKLLKKEIGEHDAV